MGTEDFYSSLPVYNDFSVVSDLSCYSRLPSDWYIVAADIKNSTAAIQEGLYKAVNVVGVSVITAVRNASKPARLPYVFGGDGASLCVPPNVLENVRLALQSTREMSKQQFGLELRVGIVPVKDLIDKGYQVLVARHRMSEFHTQAAFAGGGIEYAEELIKDEAVGEQYRLSEQDKNINADYSGLECRWDHVYSQCGETIALLVKALSPSEQERSTVYKNIIDKIKQVYGDDELCRPVQETALHLTGNNQKLSHELKVRAHSSRKYEVIKYWIMLRLQIFLGWFLMGFKLNVADVNWGDYKKDVVSNTDFKKFDGTLREVISGNSEQRLVLQDYLEQCYQNRECVYGIHVSDSALVTCMINNRSGEHFHFVDGADGGYAMAAKHMKEQLKKLAV